MIPAILCVALLASCGNTESNQTVVITVEQRNAAIESVMELLQGNQTIEALAISSTLIKRDPSSAESQEAHALALIAEGWRLDSVGDSVRAIEKRTQALEAYILACSHSSSPDLLQLSTAQLAQMIGEVDTASRYYKLAHDAVPDDPRASFFLAQIALLDKNWLEAKEWITASLQREPHEPFALLSLALVEAELGNTQLGVKLAAEGCDLLPNEPNLRFIQARVLRLAGKLTQAMEILIALPVQIRNTQMCQDEIDAILAQSNGTQ